MSTSGTEICEGCLETQLKHLLPQLALRLSLVRLVWSVLLSRDVTKGNLRL